MSEKNKTQIEKESRKDSSSLPCEVVRDLLPLYHDEVVSDVTAREVQQHLDGCEGCRQEYALLGENLPKIDEESKGSKQRFDQFKKKIKKKKNLEKMMVCVAAMALVIGFILLQNQLPIVPISLKHLKMERVYVIDREAGEKGVLICYQQDKYNCPTMITTEYKQSESGPVTNIKFGRTLLYQRGNKVEGMTDFTIRGDTTKITVNGSLIWSEEENGDDPVPEYVYEYFKAMNADAPEIDGWSTDAEGFLEFYYADGTVRRWSLDGDVIEYREEDREE